MKRLFFLLIFITSCTSNTIYKKPKDLIPKDTMIMLLEDLMIANSALFTENNNKQLEVNYMPFVFKKYQIDSLRFSKSNEYYITVIDEYIKIFEEADKRLNFKKDSIANLIKVRDSLRKDSLFKISTQSKLNVNQN